VGDKIADHNLRLQMEEWGPLKLKKDSQVLTKDQSVKSNPLAAASGLGSSMRIALREGRGRQLKEHGN